jgi:hypothetical protein
MNYTISIEKIINLIDKFIKFKYPDFSKENCHVMKDGNSDAPYLVYFKGKKEFAKYHLWEKELQLKRELFEDLNNYFESPLMDYFIDWFNQEFSQDAEYITF